MERAIDPLLTIDAKLWADEFMATKQRLGDAEFDHVMMLGWFANAIMRGYDAGRDSMTHTPPHPDAQATIAALQARVQELEEWKHIVTGAGTDQESVIRLAAHEYTKPAIQCWKEANAKLESQLTQRTAELEAAKRANTRYGLEIKDLRRTIDEWKAELERVRGEIAEVAVLTKEIKDEFDGCAHECERCGESDPMITFDIYRTVVQLAALTATSQEGQQ